MPQGTGALCACVRLVERMCFSRRTATHSVLMSAPPHAPKCLVHAVRRCRSPNGCKFVFKLISYAFQKRKWYLTPIRLIRNHEVCCAHHKTHVQLMSAHHSPGVCPHTYCDHKFKHSLKPPCTRKLNVWRSHAIVNLGSGFESRCRHSMATVLKFPASEMQQSSYNGAPQTAT